MDKVDRLLENIRSSAHIMIRRPMVFSWGDYGTCETLFRRVFYYVDRTADPFTMLPEYSQVIEWMTDTKGKGLFLYGNCGRGKSVIVTGVIPVLMQIKDRIVRPVQATQLENQCPFGDTVPGNAKTNLDYLCRVSIPVVDDIGTEKLINDYGEKYEGFSKVIDIAEAKLKPLFVSTNLTEVNVIDRYGERVMDRIIRLCHPVEFKGESLRK